MCGYEERMCFWHILSSVYMSSTDLEEDIALVADIGFLIEFVGKVANAAGNALLQFLFFFLLVILGIGLLLDRKSVV